MSQQHVKRAQPDHPVEDVIADRFSPYAFEPRPVERAKLLSCLEAARWAASSFNEQSWSFIVAEREDEAQFAALLGCLMEANQGWAQHAGVLMLTVAGKNFSRNNKPNRVAEHDVGLAVANLTVQATALDLHVHEMAGINPAKARQTYNIPEDHDPVTALALGYAGTPASPGVDTAILERDGSPRQRKPLGEFVFTGAWAQQSPIIDA